MFSPIEIKKHEFSRAMRGYDTVEVRAFLESVAAEIEKLQESVRSQSGEIERLRIELASYQRMEQNMREAMVNAQETLRDAREGARRDADLMHREAEVIAERIVNDARKRSEDIRREVETLSIRRDNLIRKLKALLRSELELIDLLAEEEPAVEAKALAENTVQREKSPLPIIPKAVSDSGIRASAQRPS